MLQLADNRIKSVILVIPGGFNGPKIDSIRVNFFVDLFGCNLFVV